MNETPVNDNLVDEDSVQSRSKIEKSLSDRILGYAFLASVAVNIGWVALVSGSNLFGKGGITQPMHERPLKVFKPIPIKHKIKPPKPPPPPPKPKLEKIKPLTHPRPHPTPPRPTTHPVAVRTTTNTHTTSHLTSPPSPPPVQDVKPFVPNPGPPSPPAPLTPPTPPAPPAPPSNPPAPPVVKASPPAPPPPRLPPPPPPRPKNYSPIAVQDASYPDGLGGDVSADGIEATSITNGKVVIAFTIDETGHFRNVRIRESCGNSELDNRYRDAVARGHGTPAIQDHIPRDQPESISFSVGS